MWKVKWQYLSRRRVVFVINMSYSVSLRCHKPLSYFIMTLCLHNLENFYILILFGYPLMFEHLTFFSCRNIFQCRDKKVRNADLCLESSAQRLQKGLTFIALRCCLQHFTVRYCSSRKSSAGGSWVLKQKQALCFVPLDMKLPVISYNCSMIPIQPRPQTTSKQVRLIVRGSRQKERVTAKEFKLKM